jgi:hypothetical protein
MKTILHSGLLVLLILLSTQTLPQTTNTTSSSADAAAAVPWSFSLATSGYLIPDDQSYANPTFTADHRQLHLEARYNYEYQRTASSWIGYNLSFGHKVVLEATPMLGAVFGNTTGIAPGCELALSYRRIELSAQGEYVFNTEDRSASFFYTWDELVFSPTDWLHAGLVAQRTRAYHTPLDVQRGFSAGVAYKRMDFTTYVFNAGWTDPTVVLALSFKF